MDYLLKALWVGAMTEPVQICVDCSAVTGRLAQALETQCPGGWEEEENAWRYSHAKRTFWKSLGCSRETTGYSERVSCSPSRGWGGQSSELGPAGRASSTCYGEQNMEPACVNQGTSYFSQWGCLPLGFPFKSSVNKPWSGSTETG